MPDNQTPEDWTAALASAPSAAPGAGADGALDAEWGAALASEAAGDSGEPVLAGTASLVLAGADRVLNQHEIDQLLGFSPPDATVAAAAGVRAIIDSGVVWYERLPMLEIVFDRMVRLLSTSLRNFFQDNVEVTLDSISSVRFGDYLNAIPLPVQLAVFRAEGWDGSGLVAVESGLAYSTLDVLLGGRRSGPSSRLDARSFTRIEVQLIRRMVELVLADAEQSFQPLSPVKFTVDRIETNPRFATITRPGNAAILANLKLEMEGRGGILQILLPYATIEPIRDLLLQSFMGEKLGRDHVWEGHLATEIWQADLEIEAVLHEMRVPLRKVLQLQVGDTLMFDQRPGEFVTLRCGDWDLTQGRAGRMDDKIAIQVARSPRRARTTLAAFEASSAGYKEGRPA